MTFKLKLDASNQQAVSIRRVVSGSLEEILCLALPGLIYPEGRLMQSASEFQAQVAGTHPLSGLYEFEAWLMCDGDGQPLMRAALTFPHTKPNVAYLGYFESVTQEAALMREFIDSLSQRAREVKDVKSLIGPVQASFWLGYRMQLSGFSDAPFTGEPHNPAYYPALWEAAGFKLKESYLSNFFHQIPKQFQQPRLKKRYRKFVAEGVRFVSPERSQWQAVLPPVFDLLSELYQDFPLFESISFEQFAQVFGEYQHILDFSMVKLAYQQEQLVGFVITFPDYGQLVHRPVKGLNLLKILKRRRKARRYVVMYLGVDGNYLGLGSALSYLIYQEIEARSAYAVAALIHQDKVTKAYVADLQAYQHHYGVYQKEI